MGRILSLLYGTAAYLFFLAVFLYAIGFVGGLVVPKDIDGGAPVPVFEALTVNIVLLSVFALQHSIMARPAFKRWWTKIIPEPVERSTYVAVASAILAVLFWQWRPMIGIVWTVDQPAAVLAIQALFWIGWGTVLLSTFLINHFDLFGLRQVFVNMIGRVYEPLAFKTPFLYRLVRHPLMVGFIVAFWATPVMTAGHLLFAVVTTAYILIAVQFEERDLVAALGEKYRAYQREVPMFLPFIRGRGKDAEPKANKAA